MVYCYLVSALSYFFAEAAFCQRQPRDWRGARPAKALFKTKQGACMHTHTHGTERLFNSSRPSLGCCRALPASSAANHPPREVLELGNSLLGLEKWSPRPRPCGGEAARVVLLIWSQSSGMALSPLQRGPMPGVLRDTPGGFSRSQPRFSAPVGRRRSTARFPSRSSFPPGWRQAREHGHVWGRFQARGRVHGRAAPRAHRQLQQETLALGGTPQHPQLGCCCSQSFPSTFSQLPAACYQPRAPPARPRHTEGGRDTSASGVLAASPPPPPGSSPGERCPRYSLRASGSRARAVPRCSGIPCPPASELSAPKSCHVSGPGS